MLSRPSVDDLKPLHIRTEWLNRIQRRIHAHERTLGLQRPAIIGLAVDEVVRPRLENVEYETEYGARRHAANVMETPMSQTLVCDTC